MVNAMVDVDTFTTDETSSTKNSSCTPLKIPSLHHLHNNSYHGLDTSAHMEWTRDPFFF